MNENQLNKLEDRIRDLETWKSNVQGKIVAIVVIGGGLWTLAVAAIIAMIKQ